MVAGVGAIAVTSDANFVAPAIHALPSTSAAYTSTTLTTTPTPERSTMAVVTAETVVDTHPPTTALATTMTTSSTAPPLLAEDYILEIPSIGLSQPVLAGDQMELDAGNVTAVDWSRYGYPASCSPGEGCTVWLAGHRSTHGAVFARLVELTIGTLVDVQFDGRQYDYVVTDIQKVPGDSPPSVIHGDLVLQTSLPGDRRILIYAESVSR